MEMIYISHPYTGNEKENRKAANHLTQKLSKKYPRITFVNPISAMIHFKDTKISYDAVLGHCKALLAKCDGIIMTGEWKNSRGCMAEHGLAVQSKIPLWESVDDFFADRDMPNDCCGKYSYCKKCLCRECLERLDCWNCNDCVKAIGQKLPIGFTGEDVWECTRYRKLAE